MPDILATYDIRINESQRQHLLTALQAVIDRNYLGADDAEEYAIDMLKGMLDDLTDPERPADALHDFTL